VPTEEEHNTTLELQKLIVACLQTSSRVTDNENTYLTRPFVEPSKRKRHLLYEMEDLHMLNMDKILSVLRKALVGV
jgi:hypothetical protein